MSEMSPRILLILRETENPELVCCNGGRLVFAEPDWDNPTAKWKLTPISEPRGYHRFTHGLGVGDINGDGKTDVLETSGWWEQISKTEWKLHQAKFAQAGGGTDVRLRPGW